MRAFVTISVIIHMALLAVISIPYQRQAAHGEAMSVELVPSNEAPSFNDEPASPSGSATIAAAITDRRSRGVKRQRLISASCN